MLYNGGRPVVVVVASRCQFELILHFFVKDRYQETVCTYLVLWVDGLSPCHTKARGQRTDFIVIVFSTLFPRVLCLEYLSQIQYLPACELTRATQPGAMFMARTRVRLNAADFFNPLPPYLGALRSFIATLFTRVYAKYHTDLQHMCKMTH